MAENGGPATSDGARTGPRPSVAHRTKTLYRMAQLLGLFTVERPTLGLREVVAELAWDKATAHRFLESLCEIGMLEKADATQYRVGGLPLELAAVYQSTSPLRRRVLELVDELAEETGLTTQVGILRGGSVAIVASREGPGAINAAAMLGHRLPAHASAMGKAILAHMPEQEVKALIPDGRLEVFASRTVAKRSDLLEELEEVRRTGIAWARSELTEGLHAAAIALPPGSFAAAPASLACAGPPPDIAWAEWIRAERALQELSRTLA